MCHVGPRPAPPVTKPWHKHPVKEGSGRSSVREWLVDSRNVTQSRMLLYFTLQRRPGHCTLQMRQECLLGVQSQVCEQMARTRHFRLSRPCLSSRTSGTWEAQPVVSSIDRQRVCCARLKCRCWYSAATQGWTGKAQGLHFLDLWIRQLTPKAGLRSCFSPLLPGP